MKKLFMIIAALFTLISANLYADDDTYTIRVINNTDYLLTMKPSDLTKQDFYFTTPTLPAHSPSTVVATNKMMSGNIDIMFTIQATNERYYFSRPLFHYLYTSDSKEYNLKIDPPLTAPILFEYKKHQVSIRRDPEDSPNIVIEVSPVA